MATPITPAVGLVPPRLVLPRRFEKLEQYAKSAGTPLENLVRKVPEPTRRVESLLRSVRDQGLGRFEFLLGLSGSGKTTFLRTLPNFFTGAPVHGVPVQMQLADVPAWLSKQRQGSSEPAIYVLYDRDNPSEEPVHLRSFFENLRVVFRSEASGIVLIWPITDDAKAQDFADVAWDIGRDSVVDPVSRGVYRFKGLPHEDYYDTANTTTMSLNGGKSLEAFGLTRAEAAPLVGASDTISEFYSKLEARSVEINNTYGDLLKDRVVPRVWILLAGNDARAVYTTVATLTQGVRGEVDVARLVSYLDDPKLDAAYLQQWKKIRDKMVYLLTLLDVRVFGLYPNVCVGAIRSFGADGVKKLLATPSGARDAAINAIGSTPFFAALEDPTASVVSMPRETEGKTASEYLRLQASASNDDKALNKALAECLRAALGEADGEWAVTSEKQNIPRSNLQPDIQVDKEGARLVCLEITWRTSGDAVEGVRLQSQNTLTTGHIQQYLLQKILSYVDDLKL